MLYIVDLRCKCGHTVENYTARSYEEFKADPPICEVCGEEMERSWIGRASGVIWGTSCPTSSGGKGGCK